jgi:hypothetical protein
MQSLHLSSMHVHTSRSSTFALLLASLHSSSDFPAAALEALAPGIARCTALTSFQMSDCRVFAPPASATSSIHLRSGTWGPTGDYLCSNLNSYESASSASDSSSVSGFLSNNNLDVEAAVQQIQHVIHPVVYVQQDPDDSASLPPSLQGSLHNGNNTRTTVSSPAGTPRSTAVPMMTATPGGEGHTGGSREGVGRRSSRGVMHHNGYAAKQRGWFRRVCLSENLTRTLSSDNLECTCSAAAACAVLSTDSSALGTVDPVEGHLSTHNPAAFPRAASPYGDQNIPECCVTVSGSDTSVSTTQSTVYSSSPNLNGGLSGSYTHRLSAVMHAYGQPAAQYIMANRYLQTLPQPVPSAPSAATLVHALAALPKLEKLEMSEVVFEGPELPILPLLQNLSRLRSLKHLSLNSVGVSHVGAVPFLLLSFNRMTCMLEHMHPLLTSIHHHGPSKKALNIQPFMFCLRIPELSTLCNSRSQFMQLLQSSLFIQQKQKSTCDLTQRFRCHVCSLCTLIDVFHSERKLSSIQPPHTPSFPHNSARTESLQYSPLQ